jgi:hypothetical protein
VLPVLSEIASGFSPLIITAQIAELHLHIVFWGKDQTLEIC